MNKYRSIKELVIESCMNEEVFPSYEKLTSLVLEHFPASKWQKTHYAWYKSKIKRGEIPIPDCNFSQPPSKPQEVPEKRASIQILRDYKVAIKNRVGEFEKDICSILAQLAYHIHPKIVQYIQQKNRQEFDYFREVFSDRIEIEDYLFHGSACVFPGVRRYVSGRGKRSAYNEDDQAIVDDNTFPRHLWCFLVSGKAYSSPNWRDSGLGEFELAHVFTHKESELEFEKPFFKEVRENLTPYGEFTCACNVALLPKGTVRPTDNSKTIKSVFFRRYVELYGEAPLNGRSGFDESLVPDWYSDLQWNEPLLPADWKLKIDDLLKYRTQRITKLLQE